METFTGMSRSVTLRPATDNDRELLLRIYEASREIELSTTNGDERIRRSFCKLQLDAQTRHYQEVYPDSVHSLVLIGGNAVGRLYVDRNETQIAILDITVLPLCRNQGIATHFVKGLIAEGRASNRSIRIFIETFNPAQKLFR